MPLSTALALQVTPNGAAQTASATVTGATAGRTVALYRRAWQTVAGTAAVTLAGTGVANGLGVATITDTIGAGGLYLWYAVQLDAGGNNAEAVSGIAYQAVRDPDAKSVWEMCMDSLKEITDSLLMPDLPAAKVVERWYPGDFNNQTPRGPSVQICPFGPERYPGTLNNTDDVQYPVLLLIVDYADGDSRKNLTRDLLYRERIAKAVRFQVPPGIQTVYYTDLEPETVINPDGWDKGFVLSALLFLYRSRETRGTS